MRSLHRQTDGFTIVELLVSLAITAVLVAIFLPAVQRVREVSRRSICTNHLRQFGLAIHAHADTKKEFPFIHELHIELLPYLEQSALYQQIKTNTLTAGAPDIPVMKCPSDAQVPFNVERTNFAANIGTKFQNHAENGFFHSFLRGNRTRPSDITNGLSNTCAMSEFLIQNVQGSYPVTENSQELRYRGDRRRTIWILAEFYLDESELPLAAAECWQVAPTNHVTVPPRGFFWSTGSPLAGKYNHILPPNSPSCEASGQGAMILSAGSEHPGGSNCLFGDGHVAFQSDQIDAEVWKSMGRRSETVGAAF
ncbi:DUF1559 domain-containing protein [Planctomicrobium sp. SH668]|uniref:DUF1559 family PulG-like putative transporter n=1 Tax=Planctomicrobium sp. SH668 TaxID=3448126 RepID=UPI003F5B1BCB